MAVRFRLQPTKVPVPELILATLLSVPNLKSVIALLKVAELFTVKLSKVPVPVMFEKFPVVAVIAPVVIAPVESVFTVILLVVINPVEILVAFNLLVLIVLTDKVSAIKFEAVKDPVLIVDAVRSCVSKVVKEETITDDGKEKSFNKPCVVLSSCCCVANRGEPFHRVPRFCVLFNILSTNHHYILNPKLHSQKPSRVGNKGCLCLSLALS